MQSTYVFKCCFEHCKSSKHIEQLKFEVQRFCSKIHFQSFEKQNQVHHCSDAYFKFNNLKFQHWSIHTSTFKCNWKRNAVTCENRNTFHYECIAISIGWLCLRRFAFLVTLKGFVAKLKNNSLQHEEENTTKPFSDIPWWFWICLW